jgi:hypothetical protein
MVDGVAGGISQVQPTFSAKASAPPPPPAAKPVGATGSLPGQAGAGLGDLQSVAASSVARGQIVDIAA